MALTDLLAVILVFLALFFIIGSKIHKTNPQLIEKIKEWMKNKPKPEMPSEEEYSRQLFPEKRQIM